MLFFFAVLCLECPRTCEQNQFDWRSSKQILTYDECYSFGDVIYMRLVKSNNRRDYFAVDFLIKQAKVIFERKKKLVVYLNFREDPISRQYG